MNKLTNRNWLLWKYLANMLEEFFDWYADEEDSDFPITMEQCYKLVQFILRKMYVE